MLTSSFNFLALLSLVSVQVSAVSGPLFTLDSLALSFCSDKGEALSLDPRSSFLTWAFSARPSSAAFPEF